MAIASAGGVFIEVPLFAGALLLAGAAVWGLIGLYVMGEITLLELIAYSSIFAGLVGVGIVNYGQPLMWGAAGAATVLGLGFPVARKWANDRALHRMEEEDIEKYYLRTQERPDIPYPYKRLAEIYYRRRNYDVAIEWYSEYLKRAPDEGREIRHRIERCVDLMERWRQRPKICTECSHENPGDARHCVNCGAMLPGAWEVLSVFRGKAGAGYFLTVAVLSLVGGVVLGFVTSLSHIYAMLCLWVAAVTFMCYLYKRVTMY